MSRTRIVFSYLPYYRVIMIRITCYSFFLLLLSFFCIAQQLPVQIENFSPEQYGANPQNWRITQDKQGIVYVANNSGLLQYDGKEWKLFSTKNDAYLTSLDIDKTGRIYTGARKEFGFFYPNSSGHLTFFPLTDLLPDSIKGQFDAIYGTHVLNDLIFFNAYKYLFVFKNEKRPEMNFPQSVGQIKVILPKPVYFKGNKIQRFRNSFIVENEFWIHHWRKGLYCLKNDSLNFLSGSDFFGDKNVRSVFSGFKQNQNIILTEKEGFFLFDKKVVGKNSLSYSLNTLSSSANSLLLESAPYYSTKIRYVHNNTFSKTQKHDYRIVVGTKNNGIITINQQENIQGIYTREQGLQNECVIHLFQGQQNEVWASLMQGISKIDLNNPLSIFKEGEGYTGSIQSITFHEDSCHPEREGIYVASILGIYKLSNSENQYRFEKIEGINEQCWGVFSDKNTLKNNSSLKKCSDLLAYTSKAIYNIHGTEGKQIVDFNCRFFAPVLGKTDTFIAAGPQGIMIFNKTGGKYKPIKIIKDLPPDLINIAQIPQRSLNDPYIFWCGYISGSVIQLKIDHNFEKYSWNKYTEKDGLPNGDVRCFIINDKLVFTTEKGLYEYDNSIAPVQKKPFHIASSWGKWLADSSLGIYTMVQDENKSFWLQSHSNKTYYFRYDSQNHYRIDSLPFMGMEIGDIRVIYPQSQTVWFGGDKGLVNFNRLLYKDYKKKYYCLIRKVMARDSVIFQGNYPSTKIFETGNKPLHKYTFQQPEFMKPVLNYTYNNIGFYFNAVLFEHLKKISYSYKLENYDKDWSKWNTETKAQYTNLPEGSYIFRVKAKNLWHTESYTDSYSFRIIPPFYRTWWFYGLQVLTIASLFGGAVLFGRSATSRGVQIAGGLATVSIFIIFEYIQNYIELNFENWIGGIIFLKVILNVIMALILVPFEKWTKRLLRRKKVIISQETTEKSHVGEIIQSLKNEEKKVSTEEAIIKKMILENLNDETIIRCTGINPSELKRKKSMILNK